MNTNKPYLPVVFGDVGMNLGRAGLKGTFAEGLKAVPLSLKTLFEGGLGGGRIAGESFNSSATDECMKKWKNRFFNKPASALHNIQGQKGRAITSQ